MATRDTDPAHTRNDVLRRLNVARAHRLQGDVAEAARVALDVLPSVLALRSRRASRRMERFRRVVDTHRAMPQVQAFTEVYDHRASA